MKKAVSTWRLVFFFGVLVISLFAIVFVFRMLTPMLESNRQAQAEVMASMVAISANTLYTLDSGYMIKDFDIKEGMQVSVFDEGGSSVVQVKYGDKSGETYKVPILVKITGINPQVLTRVIVMKDKSGNFLVKGQVVESEFTSTGEFTKLKDCAYTCSGKCIDPPPEEKKAWIRSAAQAYKPGCMKLDEFEGLIKALIKQESGGLQCRSNGRIVESSACALGIMQLMHTTAVELNVNECDPRENIMGGVKYMRDLLNMFHCNKEQALASYNGGQGYVSGRIKVCKSRTGSSCDDWGTLSNYIGKAETRNYVPVVMWNYNTCYSPGHSGCPSGCVLC